MSRDLILPVKREYFEQIKAGTKPEEFRLCTPYWAKRLEGRAYDRVVVTLGYPANHDLRSSGTSEWQEYAPYERAELFACDASRAVVSEVDFERR